MATRAQEPRTGVVRRAAADAGLDALVVVWPPNLAYLCGFRPEPHERLIALVVPRDGEPRLVCPSLEEEAARTALGEAAEIRSWRDEDGPAEALAAALAGCGPRVGIEKRHLSVASFELAAAAASRSTSFEACDELLARLRVVKDEDEVESIRSAARIVDRVVVDIAGEAEPGRTEAELAADVSRRLRAAGGDALAFDPLVLGGPSSALPHGRPGSRPLREGDLLIVDIGVSVAGYCADITRTFVVAADPDGRQREVFEVVHAAQRSAIAAARAGAPAREVDAAARGVIEEAGYGASFVHRTGHGLGLEVHEPPYLTATNEEPLVPGMVVTVEPGIYLPGWGGVRIEDDVVIREDGPEALTEAPVALSLAEARE